MRGRERQPKESARTRDAFPRKTLHTGDDRKNSTDTTKAMLCIAVVRALFSTLPVLVVRPEYIELWYSIRKKKKTFFGKGGRGNNKKACFRTRRMWSFPSVFCYDFSSQKRLSPHTPVQPRKNKTFSIFSMVVREKKRFFRLLSPHNYSRRAYDKRNVNFFR